jgi:hypothetical protein
MAIRTMLHPSLQKRGMAIIGARMLFQGYLPRKQHCMHVRQSSWIETNTNTGTPWPILKEYLGTYARKTNAVQLISFGSKGVFSPT